MNLHIEPFAHLRAAFTAGCRIQAWHLNDGAANSNDGRWDTLTPSEGSEPEFRCEPHLYRVHPEDQAKALQVWNYRHPTMHLPDAVRYCIERLESNTDPQTLVRLNMQLDEQNKQLREIVANDDVRTIVGFIFRHFGEHWNVGPDLTDDVVAAVRRVEKVLEQSAS